jgi:hypothetical protein
MEYTITAARPKDVPLLPSIELAAAALFAAYVPDRRSASAVCG